MQNTLKILYCSTLCSGKMLEYLFSTSLKKPLLSIQKFHRLFVEGLVINASDVTILSSVPISRKNHRKIWWFGNTERQKNLKYIYLPFINFPFIRQFFIAVLSFIRTLLWCLNSERGKSIIICDVLNVSISMASLVAAKICRFKTCAIVTDVPGLISQKRRSADINSMENISMRFNSKFIHSYDFYIILTEQMNEVINIYNKPYIVMEGLVDYKMAETENLLSKKSEVRILIYSGGIYEKYGIKNLIEAFIKLEGQDLRLHLYGSGEMETDMPYYINLDPRIEYYGVVPNEVVVKKQIEATLLINPRPSNQEFTRYSFPSKNMEYMVSGTPILTTHLPGMPGEYLDYVYVFKDETVNGMHSELKSLLSRSGSELHDFGCKAKQFVLDKKNNIVQAQRLIKMLNENGINVPVKSNN